MPRPSPSLCLAVLLAALSVGEPPRPTAAGLPEYLALALPIYGITVDGDLSDWPREIPALPIRNEFGIYGPTDTEGTDLDTSEDLSPSFRVGYDPQEQLLYVAVEVGDDALPGCQRQPDRRPRDLRLRAPGRRPRSSTPSYRDGLPIRNSTGEASTTLAWSDRRKDTKQAGIRREATNCQERT